MRQRRYSPNLHRTTLRYVPECHSYYTAISEATGLDLADLHRLALQLAPYLRTFHDMVKVNKTKELPFDPRPAWQMRDVIWQGIEREDKKEGTSN